jgi:hypothetical protein
MKEKRKDERKKEGRKALLKEGKVVKLWSTRSDYVRKERKEGRKERRKEGRKKRRKVMKERRKERRKERKEDNEGRHRR